VKLLFIHHHFPAQFKYLGPALAAQGHEVRALALSLSPERHAALARQGVEAQAYQVQRGSTPGVHPWVADLETKVIRGQACAEALRGLRDDGWTPDAVVAHPGWGESLFLRQVWPRVPLGLYCEFFYHAHGVDVGFDPEFVGANAEDELSRIRLKNLHYLLQFEDAQAGLAPTRWQADTFGPAFRHRITVAHDGIDTDALVPRPEVRVTLASGLALSRADEVVTFVNRQLEPYRGYHVFMRALPALLRARPRAQVLIVGGEGTAYGPPAPPGTSWKQRFADEVRPRLTAQEWARVHFLGQLPYAQFVALLQLSTVHVYLTYPFVLSWSLLEAMSVGGAIVASDTAPVREVVTHGDTGVLVDFFDSAALAAQVVRLLDDAAERARLGANARARVRQRYDLRRVCLPAQLAWVRALAEGGGGSG
jgi:glycosyltransferase involved in cell wall biosynthesis